MKKEEIAERLVRLHDDVSLEVWKAARDKFYLTDVRKLRQLPKCPFRVPESCEPGGEMCRDGITGWFRLCPVTGIELSWDHCPKLWLEDLECKTQEKFEIVFAEALNDFLCGDDDDKEED